ncbi:hypothetical protein ABW19_dt0207912 [Dactylella cylindrospora]|nr:hypothetical protein ABW19_dt0207912 [Dactylella cylindrospora]
MFKLRFSSLLLLIISCIINHTTAGLIAREPESGLNHDLQERQMAYPPNLQFVYSKWALSIPVKDIICYNFGTEAPLANYQATIDEFCPLRGLPEGSPDDFVSIKSQEEGGDSDLDKDRKPARVIAEVKYTCPFKGYLDNNNCRTVLEYLLRYCAGYASPGHSKGGIIPIAFRENTAYNSKNRPELWAKFRIDFNNPNSGT